MIIEIIDVDGEEQGRQHTPLRNTRGSRKPLRTMIILSDSKLTISEKGLKPPPSFAVDGCVGVKFVEQEVMRNTIKGLDDVEEDNR